MNSVQNSPLSEPKGVKPVKKMRLGYIINILVVFALTGFIFFGNLTLNFEQISTALVGASPWGLALILGVMLVIFLIESVIIFILARLYTTRYSIPKALANNFVGHFYSNITPGSSGGQFAQAYTFKKQGLSIANAASILVMHFIVFQSSLVAFGVLALIFKYEQFSVLIPPIFIGGFAFPTIALSLAGFALNAAVIVGILLLAKSKFVHNFFINGSVTLLGKIRLIKNPDEVKLDLQIQIENFRVELKRLQSNIPVTVTLVILFMVRFTLLYSIPYFSALALPTITITGSYWDTVFMGAYLFLVTNLVPLPGSAGASELMFSHLFQIYFGGYVATIAPLLIWRIATFYLTLFIGIFTSAFYDGAPQEDNFKSDRRTFIQLQRVTMEIRKESSNQMYNTAQMQRILVRNKIKGFIGNLFGFKTKKVDAMGNIITTAEMRRQEHEKKLRDRKGEK